jgi:hypothetical protein
MRLRSTLLGLSLVVATGALAPLSAQADPNGIFKRFTCGSSTDATILNSAPKNVSILNTGKTIQATVSHESGGGTRAAGAIGKFVGYRPPRTGDGFQQAIINFKTGPDNVPPLTDVYAQFTFNFGGNEQVRTKAFNTMNPRKGNAPGWRIVSANSLDFGGLNVKASNLVKVVLYVQSTAGNPNKAIEFGNVEVQNFQGTPDSGFVTTGRGDCSDAGLPNPNNN